MYSFHNRADVPVAKDGPLSAAYLLRTGVRRPYRDAVLRAQDGEGEKVARCLLETPGGSAFTYAKHMANHRAALSEEARERLLHEGRNLLLVCHPAELLASFGEVLPCTLHETCLPALCELFSELRSAAGGKPPAVVDCMTLRRNPDGVLRALCARLDIPFDPAMISWQAGPRPEIDGVWAPWWYAGAHKATCFAPLPVGAPQLLSPEAQRVAEDALPLYEMLARHQLQPAADGPERPLIAAPPAKRHKGKTHAYAEDTRNGAIVVGMRDGVSMRFELVPRDQAKVSVLDSNFMLGDGVWEGIRLHKGVLMYMRRHIERMFEGAKALDMDLNISPRELAELVYRTCDANGQESGVHIRLMVSRGLKPTPYQDPRTTIGSPTIVIVPEHKAASVEAKTKGIRLFTCHVRRGAPDVQDPAWNSHSKLNCISACIQGAKAGADEALMLDPHGFVATCNSVNVGMVKKGEVWMPTTKYQLHGITRANTLECARRLGMKAVECDISLTTLYSADEVFVTGTFAGQMPVVAVDGRAIGRGRPGPVVTRLQQAYKELCDEEAARGRALEELSSELPLLHLPEDDEA